MKGTFGTIEATIPAGTLLRLRDHRGCSVRVCSGQIWVTEEGSLGDPVLTEEAPYRITHDGLTLLQAFEEARVTIIPPQSEGRRLELRSIPVRSIAGSVRTFVARRWTNTLRYG